MNTLNAETRLVCIGKAKKSELYDKSYTVVIKSRKWCLLYYCFSAAAQKLPKNDDDHRLLVNNAYYIVCTYSSLEWRKELFCLLLLLEGRNQSILAMSGGSGFMHGEASKDSYSTKGIITSHSRNQSVFMPVLHKWIWPKTKNLLKC